MATVAARQAGLETNAAGPPGPVGTLSSPRLWAARYSGSLVGVAVSGLSLALIVLPAVVVGGGIATGWLGAPLGLCIVAVKSAALALGLSRLWAGPLDPLRARIVRAVDGACAALTLEPPPCSVGPSPDSR